jgi:hypothetical protein
MSIPFDRIKDFYFEQKWPVQRIANHIGVTRQRFMTALGRSGPRCFTRKENFAKTLRFEKEQLLELYTSQRLSALQVSRVLGCSPEPVVRELDRHGIRRRPKHVDGLRYVAIEQLEIGQETIVQTKSGEPPKFVRGTARRLGIRLAIRRVDSHSFRDIQRPHESD